MSWKCDSDCTQKLPNVGMSAQGREVHRSVEWDDHMSAVGREQNMGGGWWVGGYI